MIYKKQKLFYRYTVGGNMKNIINFMLCIALSAALLTGCASDSASDSINTVDMGNSASSAASTASTTSADYTEESDYQQPQQTTTASATSLVTSTVTTTADEIILPDEIVLPDEVIIPAETTASAQATESSTEASTAAPAETTSTATSTTTDEPAEIPTETGVNGYNAENYGEVKAVWISYLEYSTLMKGKTEQQFRENIGGALDNCVDLGLNTVYVHARSHGDAYYQSNLFPWSEYASGAVGVSPDYDPLEIIIEEAHSRDLSVQAWINPLRLCKASDIGKCSGSRYYDWYADSSTNGSYIVEVNGYYYLNPAYDEVVGFVAEGAAEIVANYDVDGLHIDDYFYPTTGSAFDEAAYLQSGYTSLSQFRYDNSSKLVRSLYNAVKAANPTALFSVSCQGSIENNYSQVYADVERWCSESGFVDYIVPQIYYGFDNSTQPYAECLSRWDALAQQGGISVVAGLAVYKIGVEDKWAGGGKYEWINDSGILARQIQLAAQCASYGGISLYSYNSIFNADSAVAQQVWTEIEGVADILT